MPEKNKPQQEESGGEGAPLWIISFADMISLLMAFFVMLSTFSSFGPGESEKLQNIGHAALSPNGGWYARVPLSGIQPAIAMAGEKATGSEKPTLVQAPNGKGLRETYTTDHAGVRAFVTESSRIFWGKGQSISRQGRQTLDLLCEFIAGMQGQIIVCEYGPQEDPQVSAARSAAVIEYMRRRGISEERCKIALRSMLDEGGGAEVRQLETVVVDEIGSR